MHRYLIAYYPNNMSEVGDMDAWMNWYKELGESIADNLPFKDGAQQIVGHDRADLEGQMRACDIIKAENMDQAIELIQGCPLVKEELGTVHVYEAMDVLKM